MNISCAKVFLELGFEALEFNSYCNAISKAEKFSQQYREPLLASYQIKHTCAVVLSYN